MLSNVCHPSSLIQPQAGSLVQIASGMSNRNSWRRRLPDECLFARSVSGIDLGIHDAQEVGDVVAVAVGQPPVVVAAAPVVVGEHRRGGVDEEDVDVGGTGRADDEEGLVLDVATVVIGRGEDDEVVSGSEVRAQLDLQRARPPAPDGDEPMECERPSLVQSLSGTPMQLQSGRPSFNLPACGARPTPMPLELPREPGPFTFVELEPWD